jgi:hypothetical protein
VFDFLPNLSFADAVVESRTRIVLCLREMRSLSGYLAAARDLLPHVRLIVVPHPEGTICLPEELRVKSRFVGQIARRPPPVTALGTDPTAPRIVISGGGGGYPGTVKFYNLALKATADLRERYPALKCQLIAGPLFRGWSLEFSSEMPKLASLNLALGYAEPNLRSPAPTKFKSLDVER